ncbi:C39 family peptidase [Bacillus tianshenii]|uniref:C39 family peptidase n=1 Tax=Sutcliffiella tianshenii TaxID=1463404 RepID=UPI001CD7F3E5|nr:C39 family peptidase [Bacillus tianshenii]MCA1321557.1 C39 family peptidase [Bacillus tianshenii]
MITTLNLEECLQQKEYAQAVKQIVNEIKELEGAPLSKVKSALQLIKTEEDVYALLRVFDYALMYKHTSFLARYAHKKFKTPRTALWLSMEWVDGGKVLQAEELLIDLLQNLSSFSSRDQKSLYFTLSRVYMLMKRFQTADTYLEKAEEYCEKNETEYRCFFYMQKGDFDSAENLLQESLQLDKCNERVFLQYVVFLRSEGRNSEALKVIMDGLIHFPDLPALILEKVRTEFLLNHRENTLIAIDELFAISPFFIHRGFVEQLKAKLFYTKGMVDEVMEFIDHSSHLKESVYANLKKETGRAVVTLAIQPIVQKYNYCVPACLQMIFNYYGKQFTQDEIAQAVFGINGTSLYDAVKFAEEEGFSCKYLFGNQTLFKNLIDEGVPVLLNIEYPEGAHVMLIIGYDDQLSAYELLDPNTPESSYVSYEAFELQFSNNSFHSVAIVPVADKNKLEFLPSDDHAYYIDLATKLKEWEEGTQNPTLLIDFLKETSWHPYTRHFYIRAFKDGDPVDFLQECITEMKDKVKDHQYFHITLAKALIQCKEYEMAEDQLVSLSRKGSLSVYWTYKAVMEFQREKYSIAIEYFTKAIELEPYNYNNWSYLALCHYFLGTLEKAIEYSNISLEINDEDYWNRTNHALILRGDKKYLEARNLYSKLIQTNKYRSYLWFSRALCDLEMGRFYKAIRGFQTAIGLKPGEYFIYEELAKVYEENLRDPDKAEGVIRKGIAAIENSSELLINLGFLMLNQNRFEEAEECMMKARAINALDSSSYLGIASIYGKRQEVECTYKYVKQYEHLFLESPHNFITIGELLWELTTDDLKIKEYGIDLIEKGFKLFQPDETNHYLERYTILMENANLFVRGSAYLLSLYECFPNNNEIACYAGCLLEGKGAVDEALTIYNDLLDKKAETFPLYRKAEILFGQGNYEEAETCYKDCLQIDSSYYQAHLRLSELCDILEKPEMVSFHLKEALKLQPIAVNIEYLASSSNEGELYELMDYLHEMQGSVIESWRYSSLGYIYGALHNDYEEEKHIQKALQMDGNHEQLIKQKANFLLHKRGQLKDAQELFFSLIQLDPKDVVYYRGIIQTCQSFWEVIKLRSMIEEKTTPNEQLYLQLAIALEEYYQDLNGNKMVRAIQRKILKQQIVKCYASARKLNPNNIKSYIWEQDFYINADINRNVLEILEQGLNQIWDYDSAILLGSQFIEGLASYEDRSELAIFQSVKDKIDRCLKENQQNIQLLYVAGMLYADSKLYSQAVSYLEMGLNIDAENPNINFALGRVSRLMKKETQAKHYLSKALLYNEDEEYVWKKAIEEHIKDIETNYDVYLPTVIQKAEAFSRYIYSVKDFSRDDERLVEEHIGDLKNPQYIQDIFEELRYLTDHGNIQMKMKDMFVQEVLAVDFPYKSTYDKSFLVNAKVIHQNGDLSQTGHIFSHHKKSDEWHLTWYNFGQHLMEYPWDEHYNHLKVNPADTKMKEAIEYAEKFIKDYLHYFSSQDEQDIKPLMEQWIETKQDEFEVEILTSKANILGIKKGKLLNVSECVSIEVLPFRNVPTQSATEAYAISVLLVIQKKFWKTAMQIGVVTVKENGAWKIYEMSNKRITPWQM